jgi:hypothetical protein
MWMGLVCWDDTRRIQVPPDDQFDARSAALIAR